MIRRNPIDTPNTANQDVTKSYYGYEAVPDAAYGNHLKNTFCACNTSASHTYGNVMSVVEQFLLQSFPKDMFKTVTTSTTLSPRQITHLPNQLHKQEVPIMVLIPRIVFGQDENRFLGHTQINSKRNYTTGMWGDGDLIPLAEDKDKKLYIHGHYNRAVMYVDVVCSFHTYSEQINFVSYIHNMLPVGHNQFIRAPLELYVPEDFCSLISHYSHIPYTDDDVHDFLSYMNKIFHHPITYKLKGGSNSNEFFMYYIADIDSLITDVTYDQGMKDGQIRRNFNVSFTVRCEFNTIGYFMMNSPEIKKNIHIAPVDGRAIVPIFTDVINLDDFIIPVGWSILSFPIFKLMPGDKSISFDNVLNESLRACIDYHLERNIPMDTFITIQFRENGKILQDELYTIDWKKRMIHIPLPNYHRTYRLIIITSPVYVNELIEQIFDLE